MKEEEKMTRAKGAQNDGMVSEAIESFSKGNIEQAARLFDKCIVDVHKLRKITYDPDHYKGITEKYRKRHGNNAFRNFKKALFPLLYNLMICEYRMSTDEYTLKAIKNINYLIHLIER